jgi:hypothetical protein
MSAQVTPVTCPHWVVCHERSRSTRLRETVREMEEGPSGSAIRSLIPSPSSLQIQPCGQPIPHPLRSPRYEGGRHATE